MYVYTSATMGAWFGEMELYERYGWKVISDDIIYLIAWLCCRHYSLCQSIELMNLIRLV